MFTGAEQAKRDKRSRDQSNFEDAGASAAWKTRGNRNLPLKARGCMRILSRPKWTKDRVYCEGGVLVIRQRTSVLCAHQPEEKVKQEIKADDQRDAVWPSPWTKDI